MLKRGSRITNDAEFWCNHICPVLLKDELTKDFVSNNWSSLKTKYSSYTALSMQVNEAFQASIKEKAGKDGVVFRNDEASITAGELEGR